MSDHGPTDPAKLKRQKRLEEQLRENLKRRKAQARIRLKEPGHGGATESDEAGEESDGG